MKGVLEAMVQVYCKMFFTFRWSITGQIASFCGSLYRNGSALAFATADIREVITKPIDTTYASHVSFYLLFGKHISICNY